MKKLFTLVAATAIAALSLVSNQSYGSHAVAADITYTYVGPNQFLLTLRLYRDCAGITAPTTASIQYTSSCFTGGSITLQKLPGSGQEIPPSPCLPTVISSCNGGPGYGIQEHIYQGVVSLPGQCVDWRFSYNLCCRNGQINTFQNPQAENLFVATTLDNFNFPTNSSPQFANIPVSQFCVNNQFFYSQLATDIDGDSLVFTLAPNLDNFNVPVTYLAPYGPLNPLASSTAFTINSVTGVIEFTPSIVQVGAIAVVVEEYRNGVKIGYITRDMQMNVVNTCIGTAPGYQPPVDTSGNPSPYYFAGCGATQFYVVLNQNVQCGSIVPTDIRVLTPQGTPNPVLSAVPVNCVNGLTDSILVTVFTPLTAGITWVFTKEGFDNNTFLSECGVEMPEFDSIPYNVIDPGIFNMEILDLSCAFDQFTITFDYEIMCNSIAGGTEFILVDANGTTYPITATNCPPGSQSFTNTLTFSLGSSITPATPVHLIVQNGSDQNTFTNRCLTYILPGDTMAELNVLPNLIVDLGPDQTICSYDPFPVLDAGISGATYEWFLDGVSLGVTSQTIQTAAPGIYTVQVSSVTNCNGTGDFTLTVIPAAVIALGNDTTLCLPDIIVLDAGNPGSVYQWFLNGTAIPGETNQTFQPTTSGNYSVQVNTGSAGCLAFGDIEVNIVQQLSVIVADVAICSDQPYPVLDAGIAGVTYSWTLNGVQVGTSQTYQPTQPGSYVVNISVGNCSADDIFTVGVVDVPVVALSDASACPGNSFPVLDAGNPGMSYQWSTGETSQTINPNAAGTYTVTVINASLGLSCTASATATFTQNAPVVVSLGNDITVCEGTGSQTFDAGNAGSSYDWSLNGSSTGQTGQTINVTDGGTYTVLVTDANGCTGTDEIILTVNALPAVDLGDSLTFCSQEPLPILNATISNPNTYNWTYNGSQVGGDGTLQALGFGTYSVTVVDDNNCERTDEIVISEKPCEIEIPNVFTPGNGDGKNDVFFIKNLDSNPNTSVQILNRWGNEVYSSSNYQNNWDGGDLPHGTYYYIVVTVAGKDYKGVVQLIREK